MMSSTVDTFTSRRVEELIEGRQTTDGGGFKLTRVFANELAERLDPFLMLDAFNSNDPDDYIAGFPNHPHRGFETVTYMLAGHMRHSDSAGNEGIIGSGGIQWMTAGSGVVHSEFPEQVAGRLAGFQIWVNLAAADKMQKPGYRDIEANAIPEFVSAEGVNGRVIAGHAEGLQGAVQRPKTDPLYVDLHLPAGSRYSLPLTSGYTAFLFVYSGQVEVEGTLIPENRMALLDKKSPADGVTISTDRPARALLVAGKPLGEPIAQYGPFVMNTRAELHLAVRDYQAGLFE